VADGVAWTIVGNAIPGDIGSSADVGLFVSAANAGRNPTVSWRIPITGACVRERAAEASRSRLNISIRGLVITVITSIPDEIAKLDAGVFSGWVRTGQGFNVYSAAAVGLVPVCRFFTTAFPPHQFAFLCAGWTGVRGCAGQPRLAI